MKGLFGLLAVIVAATANQCPQENDVEKLLSHEDCDKFYKCTFGQLIVQHCPTGLYFNLELEQCDWPLIVECGERNVPVDKVEAEEEAEDEDCAPEVDNAEPEEVKPEEIEVLENGCPVDPSMHLLLPHEDNCSIFYYCIDGQKVLTECAGSLHFNNELQVCDWPSDAACARAVSANKHLSGRRAFRQFA